MIKELIHTFFSPWLFSFMDLTVWGKIATKSNINQSLKTQTLLMHYFRLCLTLLNNARLPSYSQLTLQKFIRFSRFFLDFLAPPAPAKNAPGKLLEPIARMRRWSETQTLPSLARKNCPPQINAIIDLGVNFPPPREPHFFIQKNGGVEILARFGTPKPNWHRVSWVFNKMTVHSIQQQISFCKYVSEVLLCFHPFSPPFSIIFYHKTSDIVLFFIFPGPQRGGGGGAFCQTARIHISKTYTEKEILQVKKCSANMAILVFLRSLIANFTSSRHFHVCFLRAHPIEFVQLILEETK